MPLKLLRDVTDTLERATCTHELRVQAERFAHQLGFDNFIYALTVTAPSVKAEQLVLNGYPSAWVDRYLSAGYYQIDPIVSYTQSTSLPCIWDEHPLRTGERTDEFWEEARAFGLQSGMSLAIHERQGVIGIFSLSRDQRIDAQGEELAALVGRAQMFASVLHHAVCRVGLPKLIPHGETFLTARERECLKWAADGKTAWEIGQILGISERTAVFHLNNTVQKLGVSNRIQAIVRAVAMRLV